MKAKYVNPFTDFEKAEIVKYDAQERDEYESSLKTYRDMKGVIETAFDEGKMEGRIEGIISVAKAMKVNGIALALISQTTGLSEGEIAML